MSNLMKQALENSQPYKFEAAPLPLHTDMELMSPPFPFECLPDCLLNASKEVARFSKVPIVSPSIVGLSTISVAIGNILIIEERPGLELYSSLFFCLIAGSGERKTPVFKAMTAELNRFEENSLEAYIVSKAKIIRTNELLDKQIITQVNKASKSVDDNADVIEIIGALDAKKQAVPVKPSLFTTDFTEEKLFQKMDDRGGCYAVMSGEGRPVLDAIAGKHSKANNTGDSIFLAGISGDKVTRDRVGGDKGTEERVMNNPCLNVCIMVQPDKFTSLAKTDSLRSSGLLARIWPVWLPALAGTRLEEKGEKGLNESNMADFNDLVRTIIDLRHLNDEVAISHKVSLSDDVVEARRQYHNDIEMKIGRGKEFHDVQDIASKAVSQTCKLALILHVAHNPGILSMSESVIDIQEWRKAEKLGHYFLEQAILSRRIVDEDTLYKRAMKILQWLRDKGYSGKIVSKRELLQKGPRSTRSSAEIEKVISILTAKPYHWLEPVPGSSIEFTVHASLAKGDI